MDGMPKSRAALERAIVRYAGNDAVRANELAVAFANAIVAQMVGAGVVKGGTSLKFRYGDKMTRVTSDLDTAWSESLDSFLKDVGGKLKEGWNGFTGEVQILEQANPRRVPFDYVMQPCSVRLSYLGKAWRVVDLEIGHNEIGTEPRFHRAKQGRSGRFACVPRTWRHPGNEAGIPGRTETSWRYGSEKQARPRLDRPSADRLLASVGFCPHRGDLPPAFPIQAEAALAANGDTKRELGGNLFRAERQSSRPANSRRSHRMGERPDCKNRKRNSKFVCANGIVSCITNDGPF